MKLYRLFAFFICVSLFLNLSAQSIVVDVWPENVPGAIDAPNFEKIDDTTGSWIFMRNITHPKLDMYKAPAETRTGAAVIICPGGGYWGLAYKHEGVDIAEWFNKQGITAFVLKYRLPDSTIMIDKSIGPLQDAQEAIRIVRRNAAKWNIQANKIGILGFSAGGHLAASLSTHYSDIVYDGFDTISARPDFSILIYPVISMDSTLTHLGSRINLLGNNPSNELINYFSNEKQVDATTPPVFLVHSMDDNTVSVLNSINYALALKSFGIACELHLYESGGHGYGLGKSNNSESSWPEACRLWLKNRGL